MTVIRADARSLPLADASVDLIVTSPPYFALRSYTDGGEHYAGQIGSESTPAEYIASLVECTREWVRVVKPFGSIWVNLGDKYGRPGGGADINSRSLVGAGKGTTRRMRTATDGGGRDKCLMLLPERYRIACVDELGLIARAVVVWGKPNGLPESVTDRVRRSHEDWVHLVKQPRYYSAVDEIRESHAPSGLARRAYPFAVNESQRAGANPVLNGAGMRPANPLGKLPGSVWTIPTEPLTVPEHLGIDHFAAFPTEWPRRIILGWSPSGVCIECGEGRRASVHRERVIGRGDKYRGPNGAGRHLAWGISSEWGSGGSTTRTIAGYACACPEPTAPTRPAVVLDPFGGTGTTALVADVLGRVGISVDMSADYCRLAMWRTNDPGQRAKAMRVPKPEPVPEEQLSIFDEVGHA